MEEFGLKTADQVLKIKGKNNLVDENIAKEVLEIGKSILSRTGLTLPNKKLKYLLSSPDKVTLMSRVKKLGKRFLG